jgi:hypothetical protein
MDDRGEAMAWTHRAEVHHRCGIGLDRNLPFAGWALWVIFKNRL